MSTTTTTASAPDEADQLRQRMVDDLAESGLPSGLPYPAQVLAAMRRVPRHVFVPDASLTEAYSVGDAVVLGRDEQGLAVTSASAPSIVALMLTQLDVQPGHRVLEIGAGTGYNAALLSELAGPTGHVTTVDIDPDMISMARRSLAASGHTTNVTLVHDDGAHGVPDRGPYDRILATVEIPDLGPRLHQQLAPGGRLVVPLRIGVLTRSIAFTWRENRWVADEYELCGFVRLRGGHAHPERRIRLHGNDVVLRIDDDRDLDPAALAAALRTPAVEVWSGVIVPNRFRFDGLHLWLAMGLPGMGMLAATEQARAEGLVATSWPIGMAAIATADSLAYMGLRHLNPGRTQAEFGAYGHGPNGGDLARQMVELMRTWDRTSLAAHIEVHPAGTPDADLPAGAWVVDRPHSRIVVTWP